MLAKRLILKSVFAKTREWSDYGTWQSERDYYSKNVSILDISSYNDWNLLWDVKTSEYEKLWRYSN